MLMQKCCEETTSVPRDQAVLQYSQAFSKEVAIPAVTGTSEASEPL